MLHVVEAHCPLKRRTVEVASKQHGRLCSTRLCKNMVPQSFDDSVFPAICQVLVTLRTVVVVNVKRLSVWDYCELKVLSSSPSMLVDTAAYYLIILQKQLDRTPKEDVVNISSSFPDRLFSTVVQCNHELIHELFFMYELFWRVVSYVEDLAEADSIIFFSYARCPALLWLDVQYYVSWTV